MVNSFTMRIAGLVIRINHIHDSIRELCRDYAIDSAGSADGAYADGAVTSRTMPDCTISVTRQMIERERADADSGIWPDDYLETLAVLRAIAERLPALNRTVFHGATIAYEGRAYVFTAPSGTGKSTHIRLWRRYLGSKVRVINGDKPILEFVDSGVDAGVDAGAGVIAHATPWAGKEGWQTAQAHAPLAGICIVTRGTRNVCRRIDPQTALPWLMPQIYMPNDSATAVRTLDLMDRLIRNVPVYLLDCDISKAAVHASRSAMCGER